jgi:serine/threonine protein kinase
MESGERVADRYLIGEEIGQGGMARIFKALDERTGKTVAIKEVTLGGTQTGAFAPLDWFKRELKALMHLDHPSIVRLVDHGGFDAGTPYFVMEFLRGRDLQALVEKQGALPEVVLIAVAAKLLSALAAAHAADVIHRDVKPANMFLCDDGRVVLIDFGLARATTADAGPTLAQSLNTKLIGTPQFYSPEQLEGVALSPASDLFSLGASLYFLASGQHAFAANNVLDALRAIANGRRSSLAVDAPDLRVSTRDAIERLLAHDPANRPASARDALRQFQALMTAESEGALILYAQQRLAGAPMQETQIVSATGKTELTHDTQIVSRALADATQISASATQVQTRPSAQKTEVRATQQKRLWIVPALVLPLLAVGVGIALSKRKQPAAPQAPAELAPLPTVPVPLPATPIVPEVPPEMPPPVVEHRDEKGSVVCELAQWAEITIDGKSYGKKQAAATFSLPAGKHTFVFRNDRYGERKTTLTVRPNRTAEVLVNFVENKP